MRSTVGCTVKKRISVLLALAVCAIAHPRLLAQNKALAEIPFMVEDGRTIIPVTAGGAVLRLVLDSGHATDGILLYRQGKIDTSAIGQSREVAVAGAGGGSNSRALLFESARFSVAGIDFANQRAVILIGSDLMDSRNDGVIGYSLLGHYAVELDYDRRVMTLYDSGTFAPKSGWESLDIYFKNNRIPWIDIAIATKDEPPVRLSTYIDFASREALELLTRDVNRFQLPAETKSYYLGRGLSGDIFGQEATIARMRIGSQQLTDVRVAIAAASVRSRQDNADGIVGNDALRRFNVIFDYAHAKLHIRPNSSFSEPFTGTRR